MTCHDCKRGLCGFADVNVWRLSNPLDPIKLKMVGVNLVQQLTCYCSSIISILTMSLINNCTFEHSMGHQISHEDARFHLHTSDGQHYLSNQQVRSYTDLVLTNLTVVLVVGRPGDDARELVSSLGRRGNT